MNSINLQLLIIMKKTIIYILLILFGASQALANEYEYVPFVREGVKWVYCLVNFSEFYPRYPFGVHYYVLQFKGDTVINGKTYKAMHKYSGQSIDWENDTIPVYMREENKVVYGIVPDGKRYIDCLIGFWGNNDFVNSLNSGEEFVLYDFNDNDLVPFLNTALREWEDPFDDPNTDTIPIGNNFAQRHRFEYDTFHWFYVVEGIGYDGISSYTLALWFTGFPTLTFAEPDPYFQLCHVVKDGKVIYKGYGYDPGVTTGIDEVVADKTSRPLDPHYYNLMGQPVGTEVPTAPGIYIHQGKKIIVR